MPTAAAAGSARLLGRAVLPARTFAPGAPSGTLLGSAPINGVHVPFARQPVQGVSAGRGRAASASATRSRCRSSRSRPS